MSYVYIKSSMSTIVSNNFNTQIWMCTNSLLLSLNSVYNFSHINKCKPIQFTFSPHYLGYTIYVYMYPYLPRSVVVLPEVSSYCALCVRLNSLPQSVGLCGFPCSLLSSSHSWLSPSLCCIFIGPSWVSYVRCYFSGAFYWIVSIIYHHWP